MSMEENRAIVRRFFEALNQQNFAALKEHPGLYQTVERQPLIRAAFPDLPGLSLLKNWVGIAYSARCASQWTSAEPLLDFPPAIRVRARAITRFKSSSAISHQ
jgi:hypothetical protein